jgi:hypothetical protein
LSSLSSSAVRWNMMTVTLHPVTCQCISFSQLISESIFEDTGGGGYLSDPLSTRPSILAIIQTLHGMFCPIVLCSEEMHIPKPMVTYMMTHLEYEHTSMNSYTQARRKDGTARLAVSDEQSSIIVMCYCFLSAAMYFHHLACGGQSCMEHMFIHIHE